MALAVLRAVTAAPLHVADVHAVGAPVDERADGRVVPVVVQHHSRPAVVAPEAVVAAALSVSASVQEMKTYKHCPESESVTSRDCSRSAAGMPHCTFFVPGVERNRQRATLLPSNDGCRG